MFIAKGMQFVKEMGIMTQFSAVTVTVNVNMTLNILMAQWPMQFFMEMARMTQFKIVAFSVI